MKTLIISLINHVHKWGRKGSHTSGAPGGSSAIYTHDVNGNEHTYGVPPTPESIGSILTQFNDPKGLYTEKYPYNGFQGKGVYFDWIAMA